MKSTTLASCLCLLLLPFAATAERADALKTVNVEYSHIDFDNVTQNMVATGNVIITRGTMVLRSDRAEVSESPNGYRKFVLIAAPGKLGTFRVKRDGGADLWSEGHAERISYDERDDTVKLFSKAMIRQLEGKKITHQMEHAFISYDSRKDVLLGQNDPSGEGKPSTGRGTITLEPHRTLPATPAQATAGNP
jgi:lipopolysaccharide export system protein LptA